MQDSFISQPNKCVGCPLDHIAPMWAKVTHLCAKTVSGFEVEYKTDDLGRTICEVSRRGTA